MLGDSGEQPKTQRVAELQFGVSLLAGDGPIHEKDSSNRDGRLAIGGQDRGKTAVHRQSP